MTSKLYYYYLILLSITVLSSRTPLTFTHLTYIEKSYYVDQNFADLSSNGSIEKPFPSLEEAFNSITDTVFEIRLLGSEITLKSGFTPLLGSTCTIRPDSVDSTKTPFQFKLATGSSVTILKSILTLEDVQIVELDNNRDMSIFVFNATGAQFVLNRVQFSGVDREFDMYSFLFASGEDSPAELVITDSYFHDMTNVVMTIANAKVTVSGCTFSGLTQSIMSFITVYGNSGADQGVLFKNSIIENINYDSGGFLNFVDAKTSPVLDGLVIRDLTVNTDAALMSYYGDFEDKNSPMTFQIINTIIENISEAIPPPGFPLDTVQLFYITNTTNLIFKNITIKNTLFYTNSILSYQPDTSYFLHKMIMLPTAVIEDVLIQDSSNTKFQFNILDTATMQNVQLINTSCLQDNLEHPLFHFKRMNKAVIKNVNATAHTGPVFKFEGVLNHQISDCYFNKIATSQLLPFEYQCLLLILRKETDTHSGLNKEIALQTTIQNFNVNGYTAIEKLDNTKTSNDSYFLYVSSEVGEVYIQDCHWSNNELGSVLSDDMNYIKMSGLTITSDQSIPFEQMSWHKVFQFINVRRLELHNSTITNDKNVVLFSLYNIERTSLYDEIEVTELLFDGIIATNNIAAQKKDNKLFGTLYSSLLEIYTPLKPAKVTLTNCHFINNKMLSGLITTDESYQVDVDLVNNTFENNYAAVSGAVFTAQDMQSTTSIINIVNNIFISNSCGSQGGVFAFINTNHAIQGYNNTYLKNKAGLAGGVGYVLGSRISFNESVALYKENAAGSFGGSWYYSLSMQNEKTEPVSFDEVLFMESTAKQGGAIYIAIGDLKITDAYFTANKARDAGADIYVSTMSSVQITNVEFSKSTAQRGSLLFAESLLDESVIIQDSSVFSIVNTFAEASLIYSNAGSFTIQNTTFDTIKSPLFNIQGAAISLDNVTINAIQCKSNKTSCILQGQTVQMTIADTTIQNVLSHTDLISLNNPSINTTIQNLKVSDVIMNQKMSKYQNRPFIIRSSLAPNINISNSQFSNMYGFSSLNFLKSNFQISGSIFNNLADQRILIQQSTNLLQSYKSIPTQFIQSVSSNGSVLSTLFLANSANSTLDGGALSISGDAGSYTISGCSFQQNHGLNGGAISVEGTINNFEVSLTDFISNSAANFGGGIYFANQSVQGLSMIANTSSFISNQAMRGGAIFVGDQMISVQNSNFRSNNASDGGAIASFGQTGHSVLLDENYFVQNTATVGSVLRALGDMNFALENNIMTNNQAHKKGYHVYKMTPKLNMSLARVLSFSLRTSGAM